MPYPDAELPHRHLQDGLTPQECDILDAFVFRGAVPSWLDDHLHQDVASGGNPRLGDPCRQYIEDIAMRHLEQAYKQGGLPAARAWLEERRAVHSEGHYRSLCPSDAAYTFFVMDPSNPDAHAQTTVLHYLACDTCRHDMDYELSEVADQTSREKLTVVAKRIDPSFEE